MAVDSGRLAEWLRPLFAYALTLTRNRDQARDLVQECALRALAARRWPLAESAYGRWLFRILRHCHIDQLRMGRRRENAMPSVLEAHARWHGTSALDPFERQALEEALSALPHPLREVIVLVDVHGYRYIEVARSLDIPIGTVMSRLSRARARLLEAGDDGRSREAGS